VVVVHNGELYNFRELRRQLERARHRFATHGDTEVLAHLYEEHGESFAGRLRGMFAVAIWDARRRRLVLARDRFGIKPLLYRATADGLEFASELRALPRGELDLDALEAFLALNAIPAPLTIFRDVRKLPPGHLLVWDEDGSIRLERFARPAPPLAAEVRSEHTAELAEELRARLRDSVRAHLVSDVPVGVLLSGGGRLGDAGRARRAGERGTAAHVLDRLRRALLRRALLRRARRRAPGRRAVWDEPPRARPASRRGAAPPRARRGVRRAVRGLVGAPDLPHLEPRRRGCEGRALGRGRRRALRRLLHVRGRPAGAAGRAPRRARAPVRRAPAELEREGELRSTARSASSVPRTCHRSSATTAGRRSSHRKLARS
jgi:hypothetical protein